MKTNCLPVQPYKVGMLRINLMWVFHHTTKLPDEGLFVVGLKNLLSLRRSIWIGSCRLGP